MIACIDVAAILFMTVSEFRLYPGAGVLACQFRMENFFEALKQQEKKQIDRCAIGKYNAMHRNWKSNGAETDTSKTTNDGSTARRQIDSYETFKQFGPSQCTRN